MLYAIRHVSLSQHNSITQLTYKEISNDKSIPPWSLPDKARLSRARTKVLT